MATKRRGLGRGLDALLSDTTTASASDDAVRMRDMPVDLLQPGKYQPRVDMHPESLEDLANSLRAQGVVQPIVVRPIADGKYEIIAGERRWRAAQMAALHDDQVSLCFQARDTWLPCPKNGLGILTARCAGFTLLREWIPLRDESVRRPTPGRPVHHATPCRAAEPARRNWVPRPSARCAALWWHTLCRQSAK